jgi:hypothetical protein
MQKIKTLFYLLFPSFWMGVFCFLHFYINYSLSNRFNMGISLGIIVAYNLQKAIKFQLQSPQHVEIERALKKYSRFFLLFNWSLIISCFCLLFPFLHAILILAALPVVLIYIFYVIGLWKLKPLREIPFLKSFLVAFVWLMVMRLLPQYMEQIDFSMIKTLQSFLFFFFLAVSADVFDIEIDKQRLKSVPLILSESQFLLFQVMLLSIIFLRSNFTQFTYLMLALCLVNCFVCYRCRNRGIAGKLLLDVCLVFHLG